MTDPFFLETLVASDLLPFERPFVIAHEWSHLAGFADEGEANFVGWLTCLHGSAPVQYSGWLSLYAEVIGGLSALATRADVAARLDAGPREDLRALADRLTRNVNPTVSAAGWRVYDQYLKANRVEDGSASYARVVRLALGTQVGQRATRWGRVGSGGSGGAGRAGGSGIGPDRRGDVSRSGHSRRRWPRGASTGLLAGSSARRCPSGST